MTLQNVRLSKIRNKTIQINNSIIQKLDDVSGKHHLSFFVFVVPDSVIDENYASVFIQMIGTGGMFLSILVMICVILLIYDGYFAVSYYGSKRIIRGQA